MTIQLHGVFKDRYLSITIDLLYFTTLTLLKINNSLFYNE